MMSYARSEVDIDGVRVEAVLPDKNFGKTPLLFVHGGCHGSWCWRHYLDYFATNGHACFALNWYNHNGSKSLPLEQFIQRSLLDVTEELEKVADYLGVQPIFVGHSMGGMVCQQYAQTHKLPGLVLITSVVPKQLNVDAIPLPAPIDVNTVFGIPPFEMAQELFFQTVDEEEARADYALLCDESPVAALEALEHRLSVDATLISCPVLVVGAELDRLTPEPYERALATYYQADYLSFEGLGHNVLTAPRWSEVAGGIQSWLDTKGL